MSAILVDLLLLPVAALVLVGPMGGRDWLLDMTNFFRPHIAAVALLLMVVAILSASLPRIVLTGLLFAAALYPLLVVSVPQASTATVGNLRITTANVLRTNRDFELFQQMIAASDPDIVVMQEVTPQWRPAVESLPGLVHVTAPDPWGSITVASRYPLRSTPIQPVPTAAPNGSTGGARAMRVEVDRPGASRPLVLYAIHAPTTRLARGWFTRNVYLRQIAGIVSREPEGTDVIMVGDWNTAYWSPTLREVLEIAGLVTTERGAWPPPTRFFREFHLPPALGTPIDRIAVSPGIGVATIRVGQDFGSDHLAVTADLAMPN